MEQPASIASAAAVHEFLVRYLADRDRGAEAPLEDYLALFPGHEQAIARKHAELAAERSRTGERISSSIPGAPSPTEPGADGERDGQRISLEPAGPTDFTTAVVGRLASRGDGYARYEVGEELARGGQGTIRRVWDEDLRRNLAMKVLHERDEAASGSGPRTDPRSLGRFLEEAQVTGQLDHPGVVPVHELGLDRDGRVYFTMKLVRGQDLKAVFGLVRESRDGWTQTRALGVMLKVCEAMAYAHSKSVIHRDLKPSNVMVGKFGEVHVMDWGLARVLGAEDPRDLRVQPQTADVRSERRDAATDLDSPLLTMDGDVVGTPAYMSPEQALGDLAAMGPHSDVYAVGAMLYHLLAGEMPYVPSGSRLNNYAVWYQVQKGPPDPLQERTPDAPGELVAICEKAMARDAGARYADMMELADDLRAYLEHRVVAAYETGAWAEARKWIERNKPLAASLAAAVVLLVAGLVTSWMLKGQSDANAERARENEQLARAETAKVLRLSDVKVLQDLWIEADELWPIGPERIPELESWLARARALVANLPLHRRTLAEMRERALPWSSEDREHDRVTHSRFAEMARLTGRLEALRRVRAIDRGEEAPAPPPDAEDRPAAVPDAKPQIKEWTGPDRTIFGREALGLALAREAADRARPENASIRKTLAWALFANGLFDEALAAGAEALRVVRPDGEVEFAKDRQRLEETIARTRDGSLVVELEQEIDALEAELAARRSWRFQAQEETWQHAVLDELIEGLEDLESGLLAEDALVEGHGPSVPARRELARDLESGFSEGGDYERAWAEALPAIRAEYAGLVLSPQMGLVPLGADPQSGLWEFAHLPTGEPTRRGADGLLVLTGESGVVLVLLPGGSFWMGAQSSDPGGRNYDPLASNHESPVHEVELSPFFLSKYEMTQGQWKRLAGHNPSQLGPNRAWQRSWLSSGDPAPLLHPVERVSLVDCGKWLPRAGLVLPSEAQWEYAARGGTDTPWWTGRERESLQGAANLADRYMKEHRWGWTGYDELDYELWLEDGASFHAPVGTYAANAFGLHDVAGNLREWCRDTFYEQFYKWTPLRDPVSRGGYYNLSRGGSHVHNAWDARSAARHTIAAAATRHGLGVRPARTITP